jgi:hypothetical protein
MSFSPSAVPHQNAVGKMALKDNLLRVVKGLCILVMGVKITDFLPVTSVLPARLIPAFVYLKNRSG